MIFKINKVTENENHMGKRGNRKQYYYRKTDQVILKKD